MHRFGVGYSSADHLPVGVSAGDAMALAAKDSQARRQSTVAELLEGGA